MVSRNRATRLSWPEVASALTVAVTVATFATWVVLVETSVKGEAAAHTPRPSVAPTATPSPNPSPEPARVAAKIPPPPRGDVYWGAFVPRALRRGPVARLAGAVDRMPAIVMWYADWTHRPDFPVRTARRLERRGIVPMITWEPWAHGRKARTITLRGIARGRYDRYIRRFARGARAYGGPLFLRPMHEMDGNWYPWSGSRPGNSPSLFVRAWRHMHRVFDRAGATNTTWVWCVNQWSVPHTSENTIGKYWPGRRFVDWVASSAFNAGPVRPPHSWQSFDAVFGARYVQLLRFHEPIMVAEMGAPERGGDKAAWIAHAFRSLRLHYARVAAVVWYDQRDSSRPQLGDWRIGSSPKSLAVFRSAVRGARVLSAPAAVERTRRRL